MLEMTTVEQHEVHGDMGGTEREKTPTPVTQHFGPDQSCRRSPETLTLMPRGERRTPQRVNIPTMDHNLADSGRFWQIGQIRPDTRLFPPRFGPLVGPISLKTFALRRSNGGTWKRVVTYNTVMTSFNTSCMQTGLDEKGREGRNTGCTRRCGGEDLKAFALVGVISFIDCTIVLSSLLRNCDAGSLLSTE